MRGSRGICTAYTAATATITSGSLASDIRRAFSDIGNLLVNGSAEIGGAIAGAQ